MFNGHKVSVETVDKLLKNLKSSKSVAIDELDSYSLKIAADIITLPVHHLVTLSIMQRKFPTLWKYAKVLPLHKKEQCMIKFTITSQIGKYSIQTSWAIAGTVQQ